MNTHLKALVLAVVFAGLALAARAATNAPAIYFIIAVHSEEPSIQLNTPNFTTSSVTNYEAWRQAILWFGNACSNRSLPWCFQSDWNFLEGMKKFETASGGTNFNTNYLSSGKTTLRYFRENLGVEIDPHSHENSGYNYADIAYLDELISGAPPTGVVGGHIYTNSGYQDWQKFIRTTNGLTGTKYTNYIWRPHLLMGGGTANHTADPHAAGLWRPQGTNAYLVDDPNGAIAAIATWEQDLHETDRLVGMLEDGTLPHSNKLWTCGKVFNHRDMFGDNTNKILAQLDTIKRWRDAGRFTVTNFESTYRAWSNPPFNGNSSLYLRPDDNLTFSLNWQDFSYPSNSIAELRTLLNWHEAQRVPVDVFLTTWQTDILQTNAPEILGRLQSSAWVSPGYHVRPPKPYATDFVWTNATYATITNYETHGLDLSNGLPTTASGGYDELTTLMGFAPPIVGPNAATNGTIASDVFKFFTNAGVGLFVEHRDVAVNLGDKRFGWYLRPESYDWKLIEYFRGSNDVSTLTKAFTIAHTNTGGVAPWFVGVKLHDNDLIATQSAWEFVYNSPSRSKTNWLTAPWDWTAKAGTLSGSGVTNRRAVYTNTVADAATRRTSLNLMDARDILSLLATERPRTVALSVTEISETTAAGGQVAEISGGGSLSGVACDYSLVAGDGDTNNADFTITSNKLFAAHILDYETSPVKHLRVHWLDGGGYAGDRALTLVLANRTDDDDDGDGYTEAQENVLGTNPLDANSTLRVTTSTATNRFSINFTCVTNRNYFIEQSTNLVNWTTLNSAAIVPLTSATNYFVTMTNAAQFFRLHVVSP